MAEDTGIETEHEPYAPLGEMGGASLLRLVGAGADTPVRLRLETPLACAVAAVWVVPDEPDARGVVVEPRVRVAARRVLDYPAVTGPVRYEVVWEVPPADTRFGMAGEEMLLARAHAVVDGSGGERVVATRLLTRRWYDAIDPGLEPSMAGRAGAFWRLPAPVAEPLADFQRANAEAVPACGYCVLRWELDLLDRIDALERAARAHGAARVTALLGRWSAAPDQREHRRPCNCRRQNPGRVLPPQIPEHELRRRLSAARARRAGGPGGV